MLLLLLAAEGIPAVSMVCFIAGCVLFIFGWIGGVRAIEQTNLWPGRLVSLGQFLIILAIALKVIVNV